MMAMPELETKRLILRPLQLTDAPRTQELFPHWEVVRFLAAQVQWPYPPDGAERYYRDIALPAIARAEEWHWTLRPRDRPKDHIGVIALFSASVDNHRGFWLGLPWQRQGLMMEAAMATNAFWFETLRMPVLRVPKAVLNTGSRRISEKTGMHVAETTEKDYVCGRLPTEIWELTAEQWRRRTAPAARAWQES